MLKFFLIPDPDPKPETTMDLQPVGSLEHYDFQRLQDLNLIEKCLDFYHDFRWSNKQVNSMYRHFQSLEEAKEEVKPGAHRGSRFPGHA